ncbi:MAG: peptide deformylase [Candidatus Gracilibacteria bacterium]|jgi:peptide deformylase|nr:peptide deformylase [Candidatus Gracilibacteria bacterium]
MKTPKILIGEGNKVLRAKSEKAGIKKAKEILVEMRRVLKKQEALGLAAPQIGENYRVVMCSIDGRFTAMINPEIMSFSLDTEIKEEGCLSLPDEWGNVERAYSIELEYTNEEEERVKVYLEGWNARVVQHELDHLEGILFTDRMKKKKGILSL